MRAVWLLIAINATVFVTLGSGPTPPWAMRPSEVLDGRLWQLWTSTFLHLDISHFIQNMASLLVFGILVAGTVKWRVLLFLYTASGLAASAVFVFLSVVGFTNPFAACLGSSGCILGLAGASAVLSPNRIWLGPTTAPFWVAGVGIAAYYVWSVYTGDRGSDIFHLTGMVVGAGLSVAVKTQIRSITTSTRPVFPLP